QQRHHWPPDEFRVIELHHMKLGHFLAYNCLGNAAMHAALYPLALARTRITAQPGRLEYSGFAHCLRSVLAHEGLRGLYAGAWTRALLTLGVTYETVRASAEPLPAPARGAVAGGCAALASQALLVPADVVTQHIMLLPMARLSPVAATVAMAPGAGWLGQAGAVIRWIRRRHGLAGFYKGGLWSLVLFLPNSAAMWSAYSAYCDWLYRWLDSPPRLAVQLTAAPLAGATAGLLTNPIDVLRLRVMLQADRGAGARDALRRLWAEEGPAWLAKGLSARLAQSALFSFLFVLYYEPAKRLALKDEFKGALL
uniref:Mitochondrial carrier protein n=1 Tax=Macrostomum lignano TaxID=282301 RepID=A0A1I8FSM4_9PLAT